MMKLVIHPAALEEASAAIMFYDDRRLGLGRRFLDNLNEALRRTETDPLSFPLYEGSRREIPHRRVFRRSSTPL